MNRQQRRSLYGGSQRPFLLIKSDPYPFRKCVWFYTTVRHDDHPWPCLSCRRPVLVGQDIVVRRSAHEQTQGCYGPIECAVHASCWFLLTLDRENDMPELGPKGARMERYGDAYPWAPKW